MKRLESNLSKNGRPCLTQSHGDHRARKNICDVVHLEAIHDVLSSVGEASFWTPGPVLWPPDGHPSKFFDPDES
jgi:hypothetical protein